MAEPEVIVEDLPDVDVDVPQETTEQKPEVDLSKVPEKYRAHVDTEKYQVDADYQRAIEHGWKPKDVFVEEGGDEADWTGYRKFNKAYDDMIYRRELNDKLEDQGKSIKAVLKTFEEDKAAAIAAVRKEMEAKLHEAIENGDAKRAVDIQKELMQTEAPKQQAPQAVHPVVQEFVSEHPIMDESSSEFNKEVADQIWQKAVRDGEVLSKELNRPLSQFEVEAILTRAYKTMNKIVPKQEVKKPAPKAPSVSAPANKGAPNTVKMSRLQKEMYDRLKTMPDGDKKAAAYLSNLQSR